jgi:large subunit ribosomal protein L25
LINTPKGVKDGGILQHVRRELNISCLPDKLIEFIEVDVSALEIGGSLHIRDINLPEGITTLQEDKLTIAVVVAPSVSAVEEEEEEEEEGLEEGAEKEETGTETQTE